MPGQKQHPKLPNSCYLNRRDFSERVFGNLTYLRLLWPCQSQVWEACVTGRPAGGPGAAGCTLRTSKRSWHGSCAGRGDTCPPRYWRRKTKCEGDTDARCCWTDAGDEERSTWQESPGGAQDVVANPSPVKLNSLSASRGFWSSPPLRPHTQNVCIHLSTCFGGSRRRLLLFCHICFPFFFFLFSEVWFNSSHGSEQTRALPCGKDTVLLALAQCRSSGHKLSRVPLCQRYKEWHPPKAGERHQLTWQKRQRDGSRPEKELGSFPDERDGTSDQLLLPGGKTAREFSSQLLF